jgi:hypothetical protein
MVGLRIRHLYASDNPPTIRFCFLASRRHLHDGDRLPIPSAQRFRPWGPSGIRVASYRAASPRGALFVQKVLEYIGRAEACQTLASTALNDEHKAEYVKLAASWISLAEERRQFLVEAGRDRPH